MKVKSSFLRVFAMGVILGLSIRSGAQIVGLPVLDTADARDSHFQITPGVAWGDEMNFTGARATIPLFDECRMFLDVGRLDVKGGNSNLGMQAGALYSFPMTDLCDTAVRGALYYANTDHMDITGGNLMMVFSGQTLMSDDLYAYSGFGLDTSIRKTQTRYTRLSSSHTDYNPAVALGLMFKVTEKIGLFVEGEYVDGFYGSGGVSFRF